MSYFLLILGLSLIGLLYYLIYRYYQLRYQGEKLKISEYVDGSLFISYKWIHARDLITCVMIVSLNAVLLLSFIFGARRTTQNVETGTIVLLVVLWLGITYWIATDFANRTTILAKPNKEIVTTYGPLPVFNKTAQRITNVQRVYAEEKLVGGFPPNLRYLIWAENDQSYKILLVKHIDNQEQAAKVLLALRKVIENR